MLTGTDSRVEVVAAGSPVVNFGFKTIDADHIEVFTRATVEAPWGDPIVGGYSVNLAADQELNHGGNVTFDVAPAVGTLIRVQRTVPLDQLTDLPPYSPFPAETVEGTFDREEMQIQQLARTDADLLARIILVELEDIEQNARLDAVEAADVVQNGRLDALEAADVAFDGRLDAVEAELAALALPWEVMLSLLGPVTQDEVLAQFLIADEVTLGAGTAAKCRVAPAVGASIEVFQNGVSIGYLTWAGASTEAVSTVAGTLVPGDLIVLAVASADAAQLDVSITLKGTR